MKTLNAKTLFAALAAVATVTAVAAPAAAQPYRDHDRYEQGRWDRDRDGQRGGRGEYNINARQAELRRAIEIGERRGRLTSYEASMLRRQLSDVRVAESHYRANGLNPRERIDLDRRLDRVETRLNRELSDRDYGQGYGHRR